MPEKEKKNILDKYIPPQSRPKMKKKGLAIIVGGDFETGKTYFSASFPDPIVIIDMDQGTEALWDQYDFVKQEEYKGLYPDKDIRVIEIRVDKELENSELDEDMVLDFDTGFVNAFINAREAVKTVTKALVAGADIGTVVFETASWLWAGAMDYMKYTVLGLDPTAKSYVDQMFDWFVAQKEYTKVFKQMIALRDYGCNVIITVHTKPTYTMKKIDGRSQRVQTGEEFQWWDKSFRMSPIVLHIKNKEHEVSPGAFRMSRVTTFKRIRGVPNAGKLAQPMIDINYDKFVNELHMIRERYEKLKATGKLDEETTVTASSSKRRRRGGEQAEIAVEEKPVVENWVEADGHKVAAENTEVKVEEVTTRRRRRGKNNEVKAE